MFYLINLLDEVSVVGCHEQSVAKHCGEVVHRRKQLPPFHAAHGQGNQRHCGGVHLPKPGWAANLNVVEIHIFEGFGEPRKRETRFWKFYFGHSPGDPSFFVAQKPV